MSQNPPGQEPGERADWPSRVFHGSRQCQASLAAGRGGALGGEAARGRGAHARGGAAGGLTRRHDSGVVGRGREPPALWSRRGWRWSPRAETRPGAARLRENPARDPGGLGSGLRSAVGSPNDPRQVAYLFSAPTGEEVSAGTHTAPGWRGTLME